MGGDAQQQKPTGRGHAGEFLDRNTVVDDRPVVQHVGAGHEIDACIPDGYGLNVSAENRVVLGGVCQRVHAVVEAVGAAGLRMVERAAGAAARIEEELRWWEVVGQGCGECAHPDVPPVGCFDLGHRGVFVCVHGYHQRLTMQGFGFTLTAIRQLYSSERVAN